MEPFRPSASQEHRARESSSMQNVDQLVNDMANRMASSVLDSPTEKAKTETETTTKKFVPNVDAPEFVPSWMKRPEEQQQQQQQQESSLDYVDPNQTDISNYLLNEIRSYLNHLYTNPASFDEIADATLVLLCNYVRDENVLLLMIEEILRSGLTYGNFSYICGRLCAYLSENFVVVDEYNQQTTPFRTLLLKRLHQEHQQLMQGPSLNIYQFALFLADLYNQLKSGGENVKVLGDAVLKIVHKLLDEPNTSNVACAVRALHVCGASLEMAEREMNSSKLDEVIAKFDLLLRSQCNAYELSDEARHLVKNLLDNRGDWIKYSTQSYDQQQPVLNDTVFFGPDGQPLTAEEAAFLEQEIGALQSSSSGEEDAAFAGLGLVDDDYPDEDYEAFLKMTEEKKKQKK